MRLGLVMITVVTIGADGRLDHAAAAPLSRETATPPQRCCAEEDKEALRASYSAAIDRAPLNAGITSSATHWICSSITCCGVLIEVERLMC